MKLPFKLGVGELNGVIAMLADDLINNPIIVSQFVFLVCRALVVSASTSLQSGVVSPTLPVSSA